MVEKPWFVDEENVDQKAGKLEIWIAFERRSTFYYEDKDLSIKGFFKAVDLMEKVNRITKHSRKSFNSRFPDKIPLQPPKKQLVKGFLSEKPRKSPPK